MSGPAPAVWTPTELKGYGGPLLLDTHVWIWLLEQSEQLSAPALRLLERSAGNGGLRVSDISIWEVATKAGKGKLAFAMDVSVWLKRAEKAPGIRFLPVDRDVLLLSTRLAGVPHGDPADRMLIATAQLTRLPLVTADRLIVEYALANAGTPVVDLRGG